MHARIVFSAAAACVWVSACATPYEPMGRLGGVDATRISEDTAQVRAAGNFETSPDVIQRYVLRRAAEETLADGFDMFRIMDSKDRTLSATSFNSFSTSGRHWGGTFGAGSTMSRPAETLMIKMIKGVTPAPLPDGQFNAHEVVRYLGQGSDSPSKP
jgi:hypothetical protein